MTNDTIIIDISSSERPSDSRHASGGAHSNLVVKTITFYGSLTCQSLSYHSYHTGQPVNLKIIVTCDL